MRPSAACTAAATRSAATSASRISPSAKSSIEHPASPVSTARRTVSAGSPKPLSRSPETGTPPPPPPPGGTAKAALEVRRNRYPHRPHQLRAVRQRLVQRHLAVEPPERGGMAAARGGDRLEAERLEQLRRADIPGVRQQQRPPLDVEVEEARYLPFTFFRNGSR